MQREKRKMKGKKEGSQVCTMRGKEEMRGDTETQRGRKLKNEIKSV